jgi:RimJ/RimL family protein N-acetyltransferase
LRPKELEIRFGEAEDRQYFLKWLDDKDILQWFPMCNQREIEDAVNFCMSYLPYKAILTATWNKVPCAISTLYLAQYRKFAHQALFVIIVDAKFRGKGVGTALLTDLIDLAKNHFKLEVLHLEVFSGNPAINLYKRLGFKEYGVHKQFLKENGRYWDKILMQLKLI